MGPRGPDRQGQGETGRTRAADRTRSPGRRTHAPSRSPPGRSHGSGHPAGSAKPGSSPDTAPAPPPIAGLRPLARSSASGTCSCGVPWPAGSGTAKPGPRDGPPAGSRRCCTSEPSLPRARSPIRHACSPTRSVASTSSQSACEPTTPPPARSASTTPRPAPAAAANPPPRRSSTTGPPGPRGFFCQDTPSPPSTSAAGSSSTSGTPRPAGSRRPMAIPTGSRFATRICSPADPSRSRRTAARSCRCATEGRSSAAGKPVAPSVEEIELRELAHRTGEPIRLVRGLSPAYRAAWLAELRHRDADQARRELAAFRATLAGLGDFRR